MTSTHVRVRRILGSLRSADGTGVVRIEDRYDTDIDDLWSALTDPARLARWYGGGRGRPPTGRRVPHLHRCQLTSRPRGAWKHASRHGDCG